MILVWIAVLLLAFANGANDNAKGVVTLRGSGLTTHPVAILWGTAWTLAGGLLSMTLGRRLITLFNGQGILSPDITGRTDLFLVIGVAAGVTVLAASRIGAPISTTHALTGALVGTGIAAFGIGSLHLGMLGKRIVLPLLLSPFLSLALTLLFFYLLFPLADFGKTCICLIRREPALIAADSLMRASAAPSVELTIGSTSECRKIGAGSGAVPLNIAHWISAALMSFSRGLNDAPKIAALLLGTGTGIEATSALLGISSAMALGGIVAAERVSQTLSRKITPMDPIQGFSANLITALLVFAASGAGMPVSTTHVSCGSLFGIGLLRKREADWRQVLQIVLSWGITLPAAGLLGAVLYCLLF